MSGNQFRVLFVAIMLTVGLNVSLSQNTTELSTIDYDDVVASPDTVIADTTLVENEEYIKVPSTELLQKVEQFNNDWTTVQLTGKIKLEGIPMSMSTKIFMRKNSELIMSVAAPFMGEVCRIELDTDSLLLVNKMKNCYYKGKIPSEIFDKLCSINNIQNFLLGRPFLLDYGELTADMAELVETYIVEDYYMLTPIEQSDKGWFGFLFLNSGELCQIVGSSHDEQTYVEVDYERDDKGFNMFINMNKNESRLKIDLLFNSPQWEAESLKPIILSSRFREVGLKESLNFR